MLDGGDARRRGWSDVEPCYVFHPMNAYDDGDTVVIDVVRHPSMFANSEVGPNDGGVPTLDRWTIDPAAGKVRFGTTRRSRPGVPPRERVAADVATPLRLRGRGGQHEDGVRKQPRLLKHDRRARPKGTTSPVPSPAVRVRGFARRDVGGRQLGMGYVYDPTRDGSDFVIPRRDRPWP